MTLKIVPINMAIIPNKYSLTSARAPGSRLWDAQPQPLTAGDVPAVPAAVTDQQHIHGDVWVVVAQ